MLLATALAVIMGIGFRFYHLDHKVYWGDETYSSLRMFGDTEAQLVREAPKFRSARDLWQVLHPAPSGGAADPLAPVRVLAIEEPHHTPLYYELAHLWVSLFGNSIGATRALSACVSLLAIPCAFWAGFELFGSQRAACISAMLAALSPVGVLYAQQAREYALWTVVLLALYATVLRARRLDRMSGWVEVAGLVALAFYTDLLTVLPLLGLAAYASIVDFRSPRRLLRCLAAIGIGSLAVVPWLVFLARDWHAVTRSLATTFHARTTPGDVLRAFVGALKLNVLDFNWVTSTRAAFVATAIVLALIVWGFLATIRRRPRRVWLFLLLPVAVTACALVIPDLLRGGQTVRNPRYFIPIFIGLDLLFAGYFDQLLAGTHRARVAFGWALSLLLVARIVSLAASAQATTWWSDQEDDSLTVARTINATQRPILVSDAYLDLVLSNYLRPGVALALRPRCYECLDRTPPKLDASVLPRGHFTDVFAFGPSPQLQSLLKRLIAERSDRPAYHCLDVKNSCTASVR